jgi:hypothetical protein
MSHRDRHFRQTTQLLLDLHRTKGHLFHIKIDLSLSLSLSLSHPAVMSSYNFFIFSHFPSFCSLFSAIQPLTHPPTSTLHSHLCYFAILPFSIHSYSPKYYLSHHYQKKYKKNIVLYVLERIEAKCRRSRSGGGGGGEWKKADKKKKSLMMSVRM